MKTCRFPCFEKAISVITGAAFLLSSILAPAAHAYAHPFAFQNAAPNRTVAAISAASSLASSASENEIAALPAVAGNDRAGIFRQSAASAPGRVLNKAKAGLERVSREASGYARARVAELLWAAPRP